MKIAMILAAGRGERLKPLTVYQPKALCSVQGICLIEQHIKKLVAAGFERIVINHAYLGGKIRKFVNLLSIDAEIIFNPEPPGGLETGGGIVNALSLLGKGNFLVVNADIFTDYDFSRINLLYSSIAHLVLIKKPSYLSQGDFGLDYSKVQNHNREFTFAGIASYHTELFKDKKFGRFSLTPILRDLTENNLATGEVYEGYWMDIGSPNQLALANRES